MRNFRLEQGRDGVRVETPHGSVLIQLWGPHEIRVAVTKKRDVKDQYFFQEDPTPEDIAAGAESGISPHPVMDERSFQRTIHLRHDIGLSYNDIDFIGPQAEARMQSTIQRLAKEKRGSKESGAKEKTK